MARVTTDTLRQAFLSSIQQAQARLQETQFQLGSGKRVNSPSDDPVASARIAELDNAIDRLGQYSRNADTLRNRLGLEEQALIAVGDILQRVRELALAGNNASQSNESRRAISVEIRERLSGLIDYANSADASGRFLFSGFQQDVKPFLAGAAGVTYQGDQGQRLLQIGDNRTVYDVENGAEIFQLIRTGNGTVSLSANPANTGTGVLGAASIDVPNYTADQYTITFLTATDYEVRDSGGALVVADVYAGETVSFPGVSVELDGDPAAGDAFQVAPSVNRDVFATVERLAAALETGVSTPAQKALLNNEIGQLLEDLDRGLDRVIEVRADVGARLRALDDQEAINGGQEVQLTDTLSGLRDLDYAEAISRLNQELFALEVSQQTFARLQGLSLFRFL